jgi:hypothetical protein
MVKIRYADLPAGLHVTTESRGGYTIVYLLPGLSPAQRRAALTFARRSARIGHGPSLPPVDMAFAVAADRARTTSGTFVAVLRRHPMLLLPLVAVVSGVIVASMLSLVTVSIAPQKLPAADPAKHSASRQPTPSRLSVPTPAVQPRVTAHGLPATSVVSDTPSVGAASRLPAPRRLCITLGRATVCLRS